MTAASSDVSFLIRGVMMELQPYHMGLWVKTLSSFWTSDDSAISVVPSLEASSLETPLSFSAFANALPMAASYGAGPSVAWQV
jgi:hypothetical protein